MERGSPSAGQPREHREPAGGLVVLEHARTAGRPQQLLDVGRGDLRPPPAGWPPRRTPRWRGARGRGAARRRAPRCAAGRSPARAGPGRRPRRRGCGRRPPGFRRRVTLELEDRDRPAPDHEGSPDAVGAVLGAGRRTGRRRRSPGRRAGRRAAPGRARRGRSATVSEPSIASPISASIVARSASRRRACTSTQLPTQPVAGSTPSPGPGHGGDRDGLLDDAVVAAVGVPQPVVDLPAPDQRAPALGGLAVGRAVFGVHAVEPAVAELVGGVEPGEARPPRVEEQPRPVGAGHPDHHRREVGDRAEPGLRLAPGAAELEVGGDPRQQLGGRRTA